MLDLQSFLFNGTPSRTDLLDFQQSLAKNWRIFVYRNHSFELVEHTLPAYLEFAKTGISFTYSDYDDSLSFNNFDKTADLVILWLDLTRYNIDDTQTFLHDRLQRLCKLYDKTILLIPFGKEFKCTLPRVVCFPTDEILADLGDKITDKRLEAYSGTALSSKSLLRITRELGLNYLPSLLRGNLKAFVVDLDNTLYQGVLGEDGAENLILTDGHKALQESLKKLSEQGYFLCIASKNDAQDVDLLFEKRVDFPLKKSNFTKIGASWDSKAKTILQIAKFLNIGTDTILFIDDNMGEIAQAQNAIGNLNVLRAQEDAFKTAEILNNYPRIKKFTQNQEDALRNKDAQANAERQQIINSMSTEEYLKFLNIHLTYGVNCSQDISRIVELSNKTNQFIFAYKRYPLGEVERKFNDTNYAFVTVTMEDKLSNSGIIGVCVLHKDGLSARLEECFVSCRALGRGIDEVIVLGAIAQGMKHLNVTALSVDFVKGERNTPAEKFVQERFKNHLPNTANFAYELPQKHIAYTFKTGE